MNSIFIVGALLIFTGIATMFGRKRLAHLSGFCSISGLVLVGLSALWEDIDIVSVMEAFLCFALALVMLITSAVHDHRQHQRDQAQKEEHDAR
jgi:predicted membrane-bound spermidine synthase